MPYEEIFIQLEKDLSVLRGTRESLDDWRRRLIYSALGKLARASVYDQCNQEDGPVSIQHFSASISGQHRYYLQILGADPDYLGDIAWLKDETYSIYLSAGAFYHKKNRLSPALSSSASNGGITLLRAFNPLHTYPMSGLGEYSIYPVNTQRYYPSVQEMFQLHGPLKTLALECEKSASWKNADFPDGAEFLAMRNQKKMGYWIQKPSEGIPFGLMRVPLAVGYQYYLYRNSSTGWQRSQLPVWQTIIKNGASDMPEWLALANGILMLNDSLPPVHCMGDMNLMTVSFPYLLPPMEETFFKLYSWPMPHVVANAFSQRITRQMATPVYKLFKTVMESLGYFFEEET